MHVGRALSDSTIVRDLGARGSRAPIGHHDPAGDPGDAARAVLAGTAEWWARRAYVAGLRGSWLDVETAIEDLEPPAEGTAPADVADLTASELGKYYVAALAPSTRARHGRHYTPDGLAGHLWQMTRRALGQRRPGLPLPGLIRDPAVGGAALLLPPLRQHLAAVASSDPRMTLANVGQLVEGVDADPSAAWLASVVLASEMLPLLARVPSARRRPLPRLARTGDGLAMPRRPARAVVMNPPYGRVRLDRTERARWSRYLYGHANLYGLFLGCGLESLDDDGVLAGIVPTSFLAGRYFTALRCELSSQALLGDVTFVEERDGVFAGVLQETCLAVFTQQRIKKTAVSSVNGRVAEVAKVNTPRGDRPWLLPRRSDDAHVAAIAAEMPENLLSAGWGVSTGPLVWNRRRDDLRPRAGRDCYKVIWAADLDGGALHRDQARDELRWLRVDPREVPIMLLTEPAILAQRTTSPEQPRRIVCAELTEDDLATWGHAVVVENHVNVIRPVKLEPLLSRSTLSAVLATRTIDRLARCISGSVALSAYELESLPLPGGDELRTWEVLRGDALEAVVASAYRGC